MASLACGPGSAACVASGDRSWASWAQEQQRWLELRHYGFCSRRWGVWSAFFFDEMVWSACFSRLPPCLPDSVSSAAVLLRQRWSQEPAQWDQGYLSWAYFRMNRTEVTDDLKHWCGLRYRTEDILSWHQLMSQIQDRGHFFLFNFIQSVRNLTTLFWNSLLISSCTARALATK
jgi:hypothetical protein